MQPKLSILIPTLEGRELLFERLMTQLDKQINGNKDVCVLINKDKGEKTTGKKRNELVISATEIGAKYCSFFDDDDYPSPNYVKSQLEIVNSGKDAGSLWGQIYFDCVPGMPFHHSIEFTDLFQTTEKYCRPINHLNTCLTSIRLSNPFPDQVFGEDSIQALSMVGQIKTQHDINEIVYHYFCGRGKGSLEENNIINSLYL